MMGGCISLDRILGKLDEYLNKNDVTSAERHLRYWLSEAQKYGDFRIELAMDNELMGLCRKGGRREEAIGFAEAALSLIHTHGIERQVGSATTYLNAATVRKAFGMAEDALPLFEQARAIYESELSPSDGRLGGLYNNMGLALTDLGRFAEAQAAYRKAIAVMEQEAGNAPELAITYLNMASALEAELGLLEADGQIGELLDRAEALLDSHTEQDGAYAFACDKCASVFGYDGRVLYEATLKERARRIDGA